VKIYIASKTKHAWRWRALREDLKPCGIFINSTWIDEAGAGESKDLAGLAHRCIGEAMDADLLIVYGEEGEVLKGALIEIGAAMAFGVDVISVGVTLPDSSAFTHHPLWFRAETIEAALDSEFVRECLALEGQSK
jgi:hypothetical protein